MAHQFLIIYREEYAITLLMPIRYFKRNDLMNSLYGNFISSKTLWIFYLEFVWIKHITVMSKSPSLLWRTEPVLFGSIMKSSQMYK